MNKETSMLSGIIRFCLEQKLVAAIISLLIIGAGIAFAPFDFETGFPRSPMAVDAIPNLGENQQIVFTDWPGRSPQDVEDQISYPLSVALMGVPGVKDVRSLSMFGFSSIAVIFNDDIEFYWSRSRLLEKLSSLQDGTLPESVQPALGPDATALGQVFWYTIEGRDPAGRPIGGWDLHEIRTIQDWHIRFGLLSAEGISEIASVGGYTQEYQVDINPDALREHRITLNEVIDALRNSNLDVGARTTEINRVEYIVRGVGFIKTLRDIENTVVRSGPEHIPLRIKDVARVVLGPGERRGAIDVDGAEAVGGVVTVREGYNPLQAIHNVKERITETSRGLPARPVIDWQKTSVAEVESFAAANSLPRFEEKNRAQWLSWLRSHAHDQWPEWINLSQLTIVPFYDRTELIYETLGTLNDALIQQLLVTLVVVLVMLVHLRAAVSVGLMLPMAVLMAFIAMKLLGVEANIVALAGIAIAIGTIVDMGIIITENALEHIRENPDRSILELIYESTREVGSAVVTAISTTVISFLPVFTMTGAEGKLFTPLAYTKTFVLLASVILALTLVPVILHVFMEKRSPFRTGITLITISFLLLVLSATKSFTVVMVVTAVLAGAVLYYIFNRQLPEFIRSAGENLISRGVYLYEKLGRNPSTAGIIPGMAAGAILLLVIFAFIGWGWAALASLFLAAVGLYHLSEDTLTEAQRRLGPLILSFSLAFAVMLILTVVWEPLGPQAGNIRNLIFIALLFGLVLGSFSIFLKYYETLLRWCLENKSRFIIIPLLLVIFGINIWVGFDKTFGFIPAAVDKTGLNGNIIRMSSPWVAASHALPGLSREFMPALDEGSFLLMPTTMPHASIGEALEVLSIQDRAISNIPEVESVVGKIGRAETALDPAPLSMIETAIKYKNEYKTDSAGRRINFRYDKKTGEYPRDINGDLIPDERGRPFRQWRDHIRSSDDIWKEIVEASRIPGTTSAPKLQPIETRLLMLQTGMRASMGVKLAAPDLETLDRMASDFEREVRLAPGVSEPTVNAERVVGKPYLEIHIDRERIARYGMSIEGVQMAIAATIGGTEVTRTIEGRERYPVRVRYMRERRNEIDQMERVLVNAADGTPVPLSQLAEIRYTRGPQMIRSENTFLTAYVTFGPQTGWAEVEVIESLSRYLEDRIAQGGLTIDPGSSYSFAGNYMHQIRATKTLQVVIPVSLLLIFLILYFQFRSVSTSLIVFSGIAVAWAGGFIMIYLYGQDWFMNFSMLGVNMRELFQFHALNLSVAVWVGFLALFGIAVDDGVVIATYLKQHFEENPPETVEAIRENTVAAGLRRVRPCLMTSATTILALLPVLTATGRGADLMIPMAIPTVGGLTFVMLSMFMVPVLYSWVEEMKQNVKKYDF